MTTLDLHARPVARRWVRWTLVTCWVVVLLAAVLPWTLGGWIPQHLLMASWLGIAVILTVLTRRLGARHTSASGIMMLLVLSLMSIFILALFADRAFLFGWALAFAVMVATTALAVRDLIRSGRAA